MKNLKVFLCLLAVFLVSIGINANAEMSWYSEMEVTLPIHKTDEAGKGLEGAIFTLKDFNNTISFSSSDEKNGDYLIDSYKENEDVLDKIINSLPSDYKQAITGIRSLDDALELQNRDDIIINYCDDVGISFNFYIPLKLEETVAPAGYQKQDYVVLGLVTFNIDKAESINREDIEARGEYSDQFFESNLDVYASLKVVQLPNYSLGFLNYDSSKDYEVVCKELIKEIKNNAVNHPVVYDFDNVIDFYEKVGFNAKDVECPNNYQPVDMLEREDFDDIQFKIDNPYCGVFARETEARFDDSISDCFCVIQLKNKKENNIVNPETASTIGIISLITLGSIGFITAKKLRKNN